MRDDLQITVWPLHVRGLRNHMHWRVHDRREKRNNFSFEVLFCTSTFFWGGGYIVSFVSIVSIEEGHFLIFLV